MPVNLSIKSAPDDIVSRLKARAKRNHRSLQGELLAILEEAVKKEPSLTAEEILREVSSLGLHSASESADFMRADRDAH